MQLTGESKELMSCVMLMSMPVRHQTYNGHLMVSKFLTAIFSFLKCIIKKIKLTFQILPF